MNDMNDRPARDSNPRSLACEASTLPTELLGLALHFKKKVFQFPKKATKMYIFYTCENSTKYGYSPGEPPLNLKISPPIKWSNSKPKKVRLRVSDKHNGNRTSVLISCEILPICCKISTYT